MEEVDNLAHLVEALSVDNTNDRNSIFEALEAERIYNPTESMINRIMKRFNVKRCCTCVFVADTKAELIMHLEANAHNYGQVRFANDKRALINRVRDRLLRE